MIRVKLAAEYSKAERLNSYSKATLLGNSTKFTSKWIHGYIFKVIIFHC